VVISAAVVHGRACPPGYCLECSIGVHTALLHHGVRAVAVAALAFATTLGGAATAGGTDRGGHAPKPVEVAIGASGILAPHAAWAVGVGGAHHGRRARPQRLTPDT